MTALTQDTNRKVTGGNGGTRMPLLASAICFVGSLLTRTTTGFINRLVAGEPFAGVAMQRIELADHPASGAANGDRFVTAMTGRFLMRLALAVTASDAIKRRKVYASDDNAFTFAAAGNTYVGEVVEIESTSVAIVECTTVENRDAAPGINGVVAIADAAVTLDMTHVGKIVHQPVTAARVVTLPPAADWIGKYITIVNTGGAFAITITPNGAEKVGSAASLVQTATRGRSTTLYSTGVTGDEVAIIANQ
ncbi:MAG: hypothetical protein H0W72_05375 [Planctomycetes bacterium]|nr:hypothetical protein [Planctomycetota bacterium]